MNFVLDYRHTCALLELGEDLDANNAQVCRHALRLYWLVNERAKVGEVFAFVGGEEVVPLQTAVLMSWPLLAGEGPAYQVRFNLDFKHQAALERIASEQGRNATQVMRQALHLCWLVHQRAKEGGAMAFVEGKKVTPLLMPVLP